jgi:hypothetical protein
MGAIRARKHTPKHDCPLSCDAVAARFINPSAAWERATGQALKQKKSALNKVNSLRHRKRCKLARELKDNSIIRLSFKDQKSLQEDLKLYDIYLEISSMTDRQRAQALDVFNEGLDGTGQSDAYYSILREFVENRIAMEMAAPCFSSLERKMAYTPLSLEITLQRDQFADAYSGSNYYILEEAVEQIMQALKAQHCFDPHNEQERDAVFSMLSQDKHGDYVFKVYGAINEGFLYELPFIESLLIRDSFDQEIDTENRGRTLMKHRALKVA